MFSLNIIPNIISENLWLLRTYTISASIGFLFSRDNPFVSISNKKSYKSFIVKYYFCNMLLSLTPVIFSCFILSNSSIELSNNIIDISNLMYLGGKLMDISSSIILTNEYSHLHLISRISITFFVWNLIGSRSDITFKITSLGTITSLYYHLYLSKSYLTLYLTPLCSILVNTSSVIVFYNIISHIKHIEPKTFLFGNIVLIINTILICHYVIMKT